MKSSLIFAPALLLLSIVALSAACPKGQYKSCTLKTPCVCKDCDEGSYCPGDNKTYTCQCGTFSPAKNASECTPCADGEYSPKNGSTQCLACAAVDLSDKCRCMNCSAGYVKANLTNPGCEKCPAGTFSEDEGVLGMDGCVTCPQGTFQFILPFGNLAVNTSQFCVDCPPGTFNELRGSVGLQTCKFCPAGFFQGVPSSVNCSKCAAGTYSFNGSFECEPCPRGYYSDIDGAYECTMCPSGMVGLFAGSKACFRLSTILAFVAGVTLLIVAIIVVIVLMTRAKPGEAEVPKPGEVPKGKEGLSYGNVPEQKVPV